MEKEPKVVDLTDVIVDLEGNPIKSSEDKEITIGRALALVVATGPKSDDPLRALIMARKLVEAESISLDAADVAYLLQAVKKYTGFSDLVLGQLVEKLS